MLIASLNHVPVGSDVGESSRLSKKKLGKMLKTSKDSTYVSAIVKLAIGKWRRCIFQETFDSICLEGWEPKIDEQSSEISFYCTYGKMLENPPPEKMTCSHAPSGSLTVDPGLICVAPTAVTKGHDA